MDEELKALTCSLKSFYDYESTAQFNIIKVRQQKLKRLAQLEEVHKSKPNAEGPERLNSTQKDNDLREGSTGVRQRHINYYELASRIIEPQLETITKCIGHNSFFLKSIADIAKGAFEAPKDTEQWADSTISEISKVVSLLAQVAREWSEEGIEERQQSMGKVIAEIEELFPELEPAKILKEIQPQVGTKPDTQSDTKLGCGSEDDFLAQYLNIKVEQLTQADRTRLTRDRTGVKIVIPGCGLGRLPLELAARGFDAQGNELSFPMIFTSNFLLNFTKKRHEYPLHPWVHSFSHIRNKKYQTREVLVPDVCPEEFLTRRIRAFGKPAGELSMIMGSFDEIYPMNLQDSDDLIDLEVEKSSPQKKDEAPATISNKPLITGMQEPISKDQDKRFQRDQDLNTITQKEKIKQVDVVATVFFIDTSPNIFKTLESISQILVPGGYWINFGPLLWHYEHSMPMAVFSEQNESNTTHDHAHIHNLDGEDRTAGLELALDDVLNLLPVYGLRLLKHESGIECNYAADKMSMRGYTYNCEYWVAVKEG